MIFVGFSFIRGIFVPRFMNGFQSASFPQIVNTNKEENSEKKYICLIFSSFL